MRTYSVLGVIVSLLLPAILSAGTLTNYDARDYEFEVEGPTQHYYGTLASEANLYGICELGCKLTLLTTAQSIIMEPGDKVIVKSGRMRIDEDKIPFD
jgi:hypothetical protein